jgi:hypothetical protein
MWKKRLATKSLKNFVNNVNGSTDTTNENEPTCEGTTEVNRDVYNTICNHKEIDWERQFLTWQPNLYAFVKNKANNFSGYEPVWLSF